MPERETMTSPTVETIDALVGGAIEEPRWAESMSVDVGSDVGRLLEDRSHSEPSGEFHDVAISLDQAAETLRQGSSLGALATSGEIDRRSYLLGATETLNAALSAFQTAEQVRREREAHYAERESYRNGIAEVMKSSGPTEFLGLVNSLAPQFGIEPLEDTTENNTESARELISLSHAALRDLLNEKRVKIILPEKGSGQRYSLYTLAEE